MVERMRVHWRMEDEPRGWRGRPICATTHDRARNIQEQQAQWARVHQDQ